MRVTFDSNVYRRVVAPDMFPNDPTKPQVEKIHQHLNNHHISGFLSETVATLEGVTRSNRCSYFSSLKLKVEFYEIENPDGTILLETRAGPDNSQHPGLPEILENWLNDALRLGFMFMRAPRIGTPRPNFLAPEHYIVEESEELQKRRQDRFSRLIRKIEHIGSGQSIVKSIGTRINGRLGITGPWFESLDQPVNEAEEKEIINAVSEWANGDTVATHYAYGNDFLCTEDTGKSSSSLIFNSSNHGWLQRDYGLSLVSISQLAAKL